MSRNTDQNVKSAQERWGKLSSSSRKYLYELCTEHGLSVLHGDVLFLNQHWYITHSGLVGIAARKGCVGIEVKAVESLCKPETNAWVFQATAYRDRSCKGFTGFGDAEPSNVSPALRGAELRIAETRAVNRALRKAYGVGLCSIEEIGSASGPLEPMVQAKKQSRPMIVSANGNGYHLRDRLLVLIRQQKLDGVLVKAYATDFCGVKELREASREQVQEFINHLSEYVAKDRDGLLCQLNSYAVKQESAA